MASQALGDFAARLDQVQQLVDAHAALIRWKKAEAAIPKVAATSWSANLAVALDVMSKLASPPKPGRPPAVQALNSAAIALLSAHLQGFVVDLFDEAAHHLLGASVPSVETLVKSAPSKGNPNEANITKLFAAIGFADVLDGISWKKFSNVALRSRLKAFNELRNRIVHGKAEVVPKSSVTGYMAIWQTFATRLDDKVGRVIQQKTGTYPW